LAKPDVQLRPFAEGDAQYLLRWSADAATRRLQAARRRPHSPESARAEVARIIAGQGVSHAAFLIEADGEVVGNCWLGNIDRDNRSATLGIVIGPEWRGRGFGGAALEELLEHGFAGLELWRIELWARADNASAIHLYERSGFRREGVRRGALLWDTQRVNLVTMGLLQDEWRNAHSD
jgi:RimJ/RimL family protein N-acetyltransferase